MLINKKMILLAGASLKSIFRVSLVQFLMFLFSILSALCIGMAIVDISGHISPTPWIIGLVLSSVLLCIIKPGFISAQVECSAEVKVKLRESFVRKLLELGVLYLEDKRTGDLTTTAVMRIEAIGHYFSVYIPTLLASASVTFLFILWLFSVDIGVATICAVGFFGVLTVPAFWYAKIYSKGSEVWDETGVYRSDFIDNIQGMACLKNLEAQDNRRENLRKHGEIIRRKTMENLSVNSVESLFIYLFAGLGSAISIAYAANLAAQGKFLSQSPVLLIFLISSAFAPIYALVNAWHLGFIGLSALSKLEEILDAPSSSYGNEEGRDYQAGDHNELICEKLSFSYPKMTENILEDISFRLEKGKMIAFVGRSGEGKTTLVSILAGLYPYQEGKISYGKLALNEEMRKQWLSKTGAIWQNQYIFFGTIRENLMMANPHATEEELKEALRKAGLSDFVEKLPKGLDTELGEHGSMFSGGERQRLALARLFLKNPEILIFDEATSNLDEENQALITKSIRELGKNKLAIVVAHRLSTFKDADEIYYIEKGRISAHGGHEDLLKRCEAYAEIAGEES